MEQREATARMLPHSLEAEKSVLGGMLISREAAELVCEALKPEDFYLPAHQDIYTAMLQLYNRGNAVDSVTLIDALEREGKLNAVGSVSYITELSLFVPSAANVSHYIRIVEDRSVMRQLIRAGTDIVQDAQTGERPVGDMLDDAERRIFNISMKKSEDTLVHIEKTAMDTYFHIGELMALKGKLSGITTGFTDLDKLTSGLQRSDLIIVAGRPSMGKTALRSTLRRTPHSKGQQSASSAWKCPANSLCGVCSAQTQAWTCSGSTRATPRMRILSSFPPRSRIFPLQTFTSMIRRAFPLRRSAAAAANKNRAAGWISS